MAWAPVVPASAASYQPANIGTAAFAVAAVFDSDYSMPSVASTWVKFNSLGLSESSEPDFCYIATAYNPVVANSVIPVCIVTRAEQP